MIGCDIVEINRIKNSVNKFGEHFLRRILSERELDIFFKRKNRYEFLAGRFASKEAVSKSLGEGIGKLAFNEIEILPDKNNCPNVYIKGNKSKDIVVSISHCKEYAMAVSFRKGR
jgi:holo-[acyl-carrier protein] synthase